jgi:hypothetical protein
MALNADDPGLADHARSDPPDDGLARSSAAQHRLMAPVPHAYGAVQ